MVAGGGGRKRHYRLLAALCVLCGYLWLWGKRTTTGEPAAYGGANLIRGRKVATVEPGYKCWV